jgi:hypothetical protein
MTANFFFSLFFLNQVLTINNDQILSCCNTHDSSLSPAVFVALQQFLDFVSLEAQHRHQLGLVSIDCLDYLDCLDKRCGSYVRHHAHEQTRVVVCFSFRVEAVPGDVSRNPRFFRRSNLFCLRCLGQPDLCPFSPDLTVIDGKNLPGHVLLAAQVLILAAAIQSCPCLRL